MKTKKFIQTFLVLKIVVFELILLEESNYDKKCGWIWQDLQDCRRFGDNRRRYYLQELVGGDRTYSPRYRLDIQMSHVSAIRIKNLQG